MSDSSVRARLSRSRSSRFTTTRRGGQRLRIRKSFRLNLTPATAPPVKTAPLHTQRGARRSGSGEAGVRDGLLPSATRRARLAMRVPARDLTRRRISNRRPSSTSRAITAPAANRRRKPAGSPHPQCPNTATGMLRRRDLHSDIHRWRCATLATPNLEYQSQPQETSPRGLGVGSWRWALGFKEVL